MKYITMLAAALVCTAAVAQNPYDSIPLMDAVTITGIKKQTLRHTPFNVSVLSLNRLRASVNYSLTDALARIPGVSQISTGPGISKPVIRGLHGNRIQTVLLGLRFDNQQWQEEHGLGLSIVGIDRIEVFKGPSSLLYGTEAMGGVIRVVEEAVPDSGTTVSDVNAALYSNTYGFSAGGSTGKNTGRRNWRLRLGADSHADYSDGAGQRILNSRFESYNLKTTLGWARRRWQSQNHFYSSLSRFGFIMNDNRDRKPLDGRIARRFDGPYHAVLFNILASENTLQLPQSKLELNGGVHSNWRLENEGGNHISLNMFLNTATYNARWHKEVGPRATLVLGNESQYQVNSNYGSRVIIPDAHLFETSLSAYLKKKVAYVDLETGLSLSEKNIATRYTQNMDYSSGEIYPFHRWYTSVNGNAGVAVNPSAHWNLKLNASTGYRAPNLAELSSNGLHEGTFRYEIGSPGMKAEQNLNTEANINYESRLVDVYGAVYLNQFRHYIYLAPTGTQLYGFDIFRFRQEDAKLWGAEVSLQVKPTDKLSLESSYSTVRGRRSSGQYLPFMPADKVVADVAGHLRKNLSWKVGGDFVAAQHRTGDFETPTGRYWLLHSSVLWLLHRNGHDIRLSLTGDNLLHRAYYDHLSRFKYFGIYNTGRSVQASVSVPFTKSISKR